MLMLTTSIFHRAKKGDISPLEFEDIHRFWQGGESSQSSRNLASQWSFTTR